MRLCLFSSKRYIFHPATDTNNNIRTNRMDGVRVLEPERAIEMKGLSRKENTRLTDLSSLHTNAFAFLIHPEWGGCTLSKHKIYKKNVQRIK